MPKTHFIETLAPILFAEPNLEKILTRLKAGQDASLGVAASARTLMVAAYAAIQKRPLLYVLSGEEAAEHAATTLTAWLGAGRVFFYPERPDIPFKSTKNKDLLAKIGQRTQAIAQLARFVGNAEGAQALGAAVGAQNQAPVVVCSARALLRRVPPVTEAYYTSVTWRCGQELPYARAGAQLRDMGYIHTEDVLSPGSFHVHGDAIDVFPAQATHPVRFEFFGDEIDRVRSMVAQTGQTIADLESVQILPAAEYALNAETIERAKKALWEPAQDDTHIAADLAAIEAGIPNEQTPRYLKALYGQTASPLAHIPSQTLVVLNEPRALFDDCVRATEEIQAAAAMQHVDEEELASLYTPLKEMNFEGFQRWDFSALIRSTAHLDAELATRAPQIAGSHERLIGRLRQFINEHYRIAFAFPDKGARDRFEQTLLDEHISFQEAKDTSRDLQAPQTLQTPQTPQAPAQRTATKKDASHAFPRGIVTFFDDPIPAGTIIPSAKCAIFSVGDLTQRHTKRKRAVHIDVTDITFPFKPGDYVVHANHGIAKFEGIKRRLLDDFERDYFLLVYAQGDKLYVPLERVDYLTRYVGPDGQNPRLTRLGTADWTRVKGRARKNAKKLAFDLVDLYTRRAAATGHAFSPDSAQYKEMELAFPYELTADQDRALADIKADMESAKPMDRLLAGDVGFGKTEVALRAAYKAVEDKTQVMILAPTTILAQQHFETFQARLAPFDVRVDVLSRMRTAAEQTKTLEAFAKGEVDILIGTHRLLSADVNPRRLGLVIVDEEQRFGVAHKEQLKNMRDQVDVLTLSATPIPRTLQMSMSGVRDMSLIMTPPVGRLPVKVVVHEYDSDTVADAIRAELARKGQVYYVSNRVKTIDEAIAHVQEAAPEARIGVAHGQMNPRQIEDVMWQFQNYEIDVLIATTIIESGLDNPHTNTLIIEDAQRLGLAQLYQLKGRVGRGRVQAYAYFMFPATQPLTEEALARLSAINEHQELGSGIRIAMRDLEIRGAGSLVGAEQHGNLSSVGFDLFTQMLGQAVEEAKGVLPPSEETARADVALNIAAPYYFSEEYLPAIDKRVLAYRRVASAADLFQVEKIQADLEREFGPLEEAGRNLLVRQAVRIRAERLGIKSIVYAKGRLTFEGLRLPRALQTQFKESGATVFPQSQKLVISLPAQKASSQSAPSLHPNAYGEGAVESQAASSVVRSWMREENSPEPPVPVSSSFKGEEKLAKADDDAAGPENEVEYSESISSEDAHPVLRKALEILEAIGGDDEEE